MKILHFEDDKTHSFILEKLINKVLPDAVYQWEPVPYTASIISALEKPDILICDYYFEDSATIADGLVHAIQRFDGPVYVYSSAPEAVIKKTLFDLVPRKALDVRIFDKSEARDLIRDIDGRMVTV